ncbi:hypothetical protein AJ85_05745 [Alkalihalobacillus alcalophilus ATCC 27647 = CGMCC 1.3604]|uniref:Uncharacterized protein n=1 Tax=Alkalihalobacillus alcalophilus ATCC 27647 = CGMCC 1.3604 TaxID=1218173 RepID=A0A4S4K165_ALKAL|nr:hypothetical protein [Alkalihalobacillus alcalophilus]YP_009276822.1 hypothetical protein BH791_gp16 [Bacillus phage BalMu-1]AJA42394.1 hypothetical protein BalMu1_B16 [Bacillus phage BalMu-1]AJA42450.1 hypothetical protein BalMu1_A16 [Bacillus phage BalMu-1]MED1561138.1 hypothetical protein [Alkalihalobacillus alcalophilus]THG91326.1 hypothetical protein AJ85_05745 [Alkalihalobacillus alcalophilus ATCC 27647 = CGMCC 1.3604]
MQEVIKTLQRSTKLYKQPYRIGDVVECEGENYLIIGIQSIEIDSYRLRVSYVAQSLEKDFLCQTTLSKGDGLTEFKTTIKTGKEVVFEKVRLGKLFWYKDFPFQSVEYTDIEIKFTDIEISFLARPIRPISRKEAKAKLLSERKKKLNLTLI